MFRASRRATARASIVAYNELSAPTGAATMRPGLLRISVENQTVRRVMPSVWIIGHGLHEILGRRRPFLTAKRLLSNQTFRDLYRAEALDIDQR